MIRLRRPVGTLGRFQQSPPLGVGFKLRAALSARAVSHSNADEDTLRAMRAASPALQERWPEGESPRSWVGVTWSGNRVQELILYRRESDGAVPDKFPWVFTRPNQVLGMKLDVDVLPKEVGQLDALIKLYLDGCPMEKVPPEVAQLVNLNDLHVNGCPKIKMELPEGVTDYFSVTAQEVIACYAPLLIVEPRKETPGQLHAFLLDNPLAVPPFFKSILTWAAHATWLGEAVKATPSLAGLTDALGRSAADAAHATCRQKMQAALLLTDAGKEQAALLLTKARAAPPNSLRARAARPSPHPVLIAHAPPSPPRVA